MGVQELPTIELILKDLNADRFELTAHARRRMMERNISRRDIVSLGLRFLLVERQKGGKFRIEGEDCDGEELVVVCVYESGTLIITVY